MPQGAWLPLRAEHFFAANVRMEREARGMTQAKVARAMTARGVPLSQSAIAKLERSDDASRRPISLTEAAALATFFHRSLDDMTTTPADQISRALVEAKTRLERAERDQAAATTERYMAFEAARKAQEEYDAAMAKADDEKDEKDS